MDEYQILEFLPAALVRTAGERGQVPLVEFSHFSVLEYLKSTRMSPELLSTYHVEDTAAHRMISESCLGYILHIGDNEQGLVGKISDFVQSSRQHTYETKEIEYHYIIRQKPENNTAGHNELDNENICKQLDGRYILAAYANTAWHYHLTQLGDVTDENVHRLTSEFLSLSKGIWLLWCYLFSSTTSLRAEPMGRDLRGPL